MSGIRPCRGGPQVPSTGAPPGVRPSARPSFPPRPRSRRPIQLISNREPLRLEIDVTQTKQTTDPHSNLEKQPVFKSTCRGGPSVPFTDSPPGFLPRAKPRGRPSFRPSFLPPQSTPRPQFTDPNPNYKPTQKPKSTKSPPQGLFRLERTPTLYFLQLTRILNEPMFRLETELHSTCHQGHCPAVPFSPPAPRASLLIRCPNAANQSDAARGSVFAFRFASMAGLRTTALFET
jgi:hypothetical protein